MSCCQAQEWSRALVRHGNGFTDRFPQIARACEKFPADTLIDGEVIVLDENGRCLKVSTASQKAIFSCTPSICSFTAAATCSASR